MSYYIQYGTRDQLINDHNHKFEFELVVGRKSVIGGGGDCTDAAACAAGELNVGGSNLDAKRIHA